MSDDSNCCNLIETTSTAVLFAGIIYGLRKEMQEKDDKQTITILGASITLILLLFTMSFYQSYVKTDCDIMLSDMAVAMRAMSSALFTTDIFVKNEILGNKWDYMPAVIGGILCVVYLAQDCECDKCYMQLYMIMNMVAQVFVAAKTSNQYLAIAGSSLFLAYSLCHDGEGFLEVSPVVWYNFLAGAYTFTCRGEPIELK